MYSNALITLFTSTYNRRELIERLYQSLLQQTQKNFEWIVIDDGSTDDTEVYFEKLASKPHPFPIHYFKQQNGGKHRAINNGVCKAQGDLFFIVDSDDYLTDNAIEKINGWYKTLDDTHKWAGISGLKGYSTKSVVGQNNSNQKFIDAKNSERRKNHLEGDKAEIYFTDVLRKYRFPEIPGENFISEEIVWNTIARDGYYLRWFNEIIYICEYLEDGLTKDNTKEQRNPQGCLLWAKGQIKTFPDDWRKRYLAIAIYRNAVPKKKTSDVAKDLSVHTSTVLLATFFFRTYQTVQSR